MEGRESLLKNLKTSQRILTLSLLLVNHGNFLKNIIASQPFQNRVATDQKKCLAFT